LYPNKIVNTPEDLSGKLFITVTEGRDANGRYAHYFAMTVGKSNEIGKEVIAMARNKGTDLQTLRLIHHSPVTKAIEKIILQGRQYIHNIAFAGNVIEAYERAWNDGRQSVIISN